MPIPIVNHLCSHYVVIPYCDLVCVAYKADFILMSVNVHRVIFFVRSHVVDVVSIVLAQARTHLA